jgi:hypothetical protein
MDSIYGWKTLKKIVDYIIRDLIFQSRMNRVREHLIGKGHKVPYIFWYRHKKRKVR